MNLEVFEYLLTIEKCGSLNKAAQELYVSQPNLTSAIQSFEKEVGYSILDRNHKGVTFTEKGKQVLIIAHHISEEKYNLYNINQINQSLSLKISIGNSNDVLRALFSSIQTSLSHDINIMIQNLPVMEALESVYTQNNNLAYIIIPTSQDKLIKEYCRIHHLEPYFFKENDCCITLSKKHPLSRKKFSYEDLWEYPFVDFINQKDNPYGSFQKYINPRKMILIDNSNLRKEVLSLTDAYTIGLEPKQKDKNYYYKTIPDLKMHLVEIRRQSDKNSTLYNQIRNTLSNV